MSHRQVDNRNSVHEEARRKRNLTESSVGNRSEEDTVFLGPGDPLATPSPDGSNGRDVGPQHVSWKFLLLLGTRKRGVIRYVV